MPYSGVLRFPANPMPPALKLFACLALASCALVGSLVKTAPAQAASPCWKALLNDWYDGRIDKVYARHCYTDALKHLPDDVATYSSARDDIQRALQSATTKGSGSSTTTTNADAPVPPPGSDGNGGEPVGREPEQGVSGVADKLNPGDASSVPLPLLVLGGLAILLVAAGGAGLIAKRVQARRQQP
jgi:hypothetical protein